MSNTTLVGIFDDDAHAQQARQRLQRAGVPPHCIHINAGAPDRSETTSCAQPREEEGAISRFFSDMFGSHDEPDVHNYDEAVRRGNRVLSVQVADESRVDVISDLLEECGAVDVDERVESWKATGYEPMSPRGANSGGGTATDLVANDVLGMGEARQLSAAGADDDEAMKLAEEELKVGKRRFEQGGGRVRRYPTERSVEEQVSLHGEKAQIDRIRVDRPASQADLPLGSQGNRGLFDKGAAAANMATRCGGPERRMGDARSYGGVERRAAA